MSKKLSQMTWLEVQEKMNAIGSPKKIIELGRAIEQLLGDEVDTKNRAELSNVELMLERVLEEIRRIRRLYDKSHR